MQKKLIITALLLCCAVFAVLAAIADLNGKWVGKTQMDGNDIPLTYIFKVDGETLTGTGESPYGLHSIDKGKVKGNEFSFSTTVDGGLEVPQKGKLYADSIGLDLQVNGEILHATLTRAK